MLSKEKTMEILKQFSQECYNFWIMQGKNHGESFELMLADIAEKTLKF